MAYRQKWREYCLLLCVGLILIALALLPLSGSVIYIKPSAPINLLYVASGVFALVFWRDFARVKAIAPLIGFFAIVLALGALSSLYSANSYETLQNVRRLAFDGLFMLISYLVLRRLDSRGFAIFFMLLLVVVFIQPVATIVDFGIDYANGDISVNTRATGFKNDQALVYSFILLFAAALSIAMLWLTRGKARLYSAGLFAIALLAILANNSRLVFVALFVALLLPFLLFRFAYKRWILAFVGGLALAFVAVVYVASAQWNERYNFHKMANHLSYVLSFEPALMGRFDKACTPEVIFYNNAFDFTAPLPFHAYNHNSLFFTKYSAIPALIKEFSALESSADFTIKGAYLRTSRHYGWLLCSRFSFPKDEIFSWEHSSLARLSMNKSVLQAIWQSPLRPNGFGFLGYVDNLEQIFPRDSLHHSYVLSLPDRPAGYPHPHNQLLSLAFELSILGLVAIGGFCYMVFFHKLRLVLRTIESRLDSSSSGALSFSQALACSSYGIVFVGGVVFIVALSVAMIFDCLLWRWNTTYLFVLFGIVLAAKDALLRQESKLIRNVYGSFVATTGDKVVGSSTIKEALNGDKRESS